MASIKQISFVLGISVVLIAALGFWVESRNQPTEVLLTTEENLEGPLSPEEIKIDNQDITNTMNRIATFTTNRGVIKIELFEDQMPITTGNFISLAESGFYDGTKFHRVIDNFMIQGGDPNSRGNDESIYGRGGPEENVQDEFVAGELLTNTRGTIAMANTGQPNSGGSQFFINTVDNTNLDFNKEPLTSKHPVFGRVVEGLDIVDEISRTTTKIGDIPAEPVVVESITIAES
jgi:cyclophilin family peptidyl-prolyl cis-trans isomerase